MAAFIPVILCGGAGTRLWPVSREALPKPFIKLPDGESLLLKTLRRAARQRGVTHQLVVTNRDHYFLVQDECEQLKGAAPVECLLEPVARNTAPAICAAALHVARRHGEDAVLLVLPADHLISDLAAFGKAVEEARRLAAEGWIVTFAIPPARPAPGFGYIEAGESLGGAASRVVRFVEKPTLAEAETMVASKRYSWNSGMFCFSAKAGIEALARHAPETLAAVEAALAGTNFERTPPVISAEAFARAPDLAFDRAVMEKTDRAATVRGAFDWSDVGTWNALAELSAPDALGNRVNGEALLIDSADCFVQSDGRMVAAVGVDNLMIVDSPDALLVVHRERAQDVKTVVERLKLASHDTARHHRTVHRPWGSFTVLEEGPRFKIKRIVVKPGASLSLQMHHHRSEHWVVVAGAAKVINGERESFVRTDESTYIPAGTRHRLSNEGKVDCVLIEVQAGDYVGEDDIVRFEDRYGR